MITKGSPYPALHSETQGKGSFSDVFPERTRSNHSLAIRTNSSCIFEGYSDPIPSRSKYARGRCERVEQPVRNPRARTLVPLQRNGMVGLTYRERPVAPRGPLLAVTGTSARVQPRTHQPTTRVAFVQRWTQRLRWRVAGGAEPEGVKVATRTSIVCPEWS